MDENESNKDIDRIVEKYKHHPSVTAIKQTFPGLSFSFKPVVRQDILKEIKSLNSAKATQEHDIATKILKEMMICLLIFFTLFLMNLSKQENFHLVWTKQI